jgi:ABC-type lipoprotein export system ATPase subunit
VTGQGGTLLEVRHVEKSYRRGPEEVHALRGVTFSIEWGEVVALVGPSGSGKTTLINILCGWERADAGEIQWHDGTTTSPESRPWSQLAVVPQDLGLIEELSVWENVELPVRLGGRNGDRVSGRDRARMLLEGFGLGELRDRTPSEISLGEQQRTALARALVLRPRLLLGDEPTAHQDEHWVRGVLRAFRTVASEGTSCLIATHNREALRLVDRIIEIRDGQIAPPRTPRGAPPERPGAAWPGTP